MTELIAAAETAGMLPVSVFSSPGDGKKTPLQWWVAPVAGFGVDHAANARRVTMVESAVRLPVSWEQQTRLRWVTTDQWRVLFSG